MDTTNKEDYTKKSRGLSLLSGGLDSQLAVCVLREAGAEVEGVAFTTPFFNGEAAKKAAAALKIKLHVIDFTDDELALIKAPPHGFGGAMNPCIDCHARMIERAGEMMKAMDFDFVATGEVVNQRPMSQTKQSLSVVEKCSGLKGRLVRPLSAQLLEPTIPEIEGKLNRAKLRGISGRCREEQISLAKKYGLVDYPSPAGGCKLTEKGFGRRLRDLLEHEGFEDRRLVELLNYARRYRLPGKSGVILGRDANENKILREALQAGDTLYAPVSVPGPTALVPKLSSEDEELILSLVCAHSRTDQFAGEVVVKIITSTSVREKAVPRPYAREAFAMYQIT